MVAENSSLCAFAIQILHFGHNVKDTAGQAECLWAIGQKAFGQVLRPKPY